MIVQLKEHKVWIPIHFRIFKNRRFGVGFSISRKCFGITQKSSDTFYHILFGVSYSQKENNYKTLVFWFLFLNINIGIFNENKKDIFEQ